LYSSPSYAPVELNWVRYFTHGLYRAVVLRRFAAAFASRAGLQKLYDSLSGMGLDRKFGGARFSVAILIVISAIIPSLSRRLHR
jgi:hypothetical protein